MTNDDKEQIKKLNKRTEENMLMADYIDMLYAEHRAFEKGEVVHSINSLNRFRDDWNWLMPIVAKLVSNARPKGMCDFNPKFNPIDLIGEIIKNDINKTFKIAIGMIKNLEKKS